MSVNEIKQKRDGVHLLNLKRDFMRYFSILFVMIVVMTSAINMSIIFADANDDALGEFSLQPATTTDEFSPINNQITSIYDSKIKDDNSVSWNAVLKMAGITQINEDANFAQVHIEDDSVEIVVGFSPSNGFSYDSFIKTIEKGCEIISENQQLNAINIRVPIAQLNSVLTTYQNLDYVRYVQPNQCITVDGEPNDPSWVDQWGPQRIEVPKAWSLESGNISSVLVAVIDSGIDYNHSDLSAQYVALGYDWYNDDDDPFDDYGHGTHCAGIIAATINNSLGIAGVANVKIMAEKFLSSYGTGSAFGGASAITHAVDAGADILSNSWGGGAPDILIEDALKYAAANDVIIVASAGNSGNDLPNYPAYYPEAISVSATNILDDLASFSTYGSTIEIAAPGVDIYSTVPVSQGSYAYKSGTSMACPHVSGVAALIKSAYPSWSAERIRSKLQESTEDLGAPGRDIYFGYGLINAWYAVQPPQPHDLKVTIEAPLTQSGNSSVNLTATIYNYGLSNETSVELQIYLNKTLVANQVFAELNVNEKEFLTYNWTPTEFGEFNITAYAVPVSGETWLLNNNMTVFSNVVPPEKRILFIQNHGEVSYISELLDFYTNLGYFVDVFSTGNLSDTLLSEYLFAFTSESGFNWLPSEITALNNFMISGGLFVGIGDSPPTNGTLELCEMYGITFTGVGGGSSGATTKFNAFHPIMTGVSTIYLPSPFNAITISSPAEWLIKDATDTFIYGASVDVGFGHFVVLADDFGMYPLEGDNEIMFENLLKWPQYDHDLSAFVNVEKPHKDEESSIEAGAFNRGLENETNIELELYINETKVANKTISFFESKTLEYLYYNWTPTEFAVYNITVSITITENDSQPNNNILTEWITIFDLKNYLAYDDSYFNWIDSTGGTLIPLTDDSSATVQLPFDFLFYDQIFSEIHVSSNGWLSFANPYCSHLSGPDFPTVDPDFTYAIAPYLTDLYPTGNIYYLTLTNPNRFVIIYEEINYFGGGTAGSIEVILYENGDLAFQYKDLTNLRIASTIGLNYGLDVEYFNYMDPTVEPFIGTTAQYAIYFTQNPPEHDLIASIEANTNMKKDDSQIINATTLNFGQHTETDVEVKLWVDEVLEDTTTYSSILSNNFEILQYSFLATTIGEINVTFEILPVLDEESILNNKVTVIISVYEIGDGSIAILNSVALPSYSIGGFSNNFIVIEEGLSDRGYDTYVVTNDDIVDGILDSFTTLILIDNLPNDDASTIIGTWCKSGGNLLSFDSSICLLNYEGILPPEAVGSNGKDTYWDYNSQTYGYIRNIGHPIMSGYTLDATITGNLGNAQIFTDEIATTSASPYFTSLVEHETDSTKSYISAYHNPSFGKVVQIWASNHWANLELRQMITNTLDWFDLGTSELSLTVERPQDNKTIFGSVNIKWSTIQENDLPVSCSVEYWNGTEWINLVSFTNESSYRWNTKGLETGSYYKLKVIAFDGTNVCQVIVDNLTINNNLVYAIAIPIVAVGTGASIGLGFYIARILKRRTNLG